MGHLPCGLFQLDHVWVLMQDAYGKEPCLSACQVADGLPVLIPLLTASIFIFFNPMTA